MTTLLAINTKQTRKRVPPHKHKYYRYDRNGNVVTEQEGPFDDGLGAGGYEVQDLDGGTRVVNYGWGLETAGGTTSDKRFRRDYQWNERNQMKSSIDGQYQVKYTYGQDGERTGKYSVAMSGGRESETLYFNRMWAWRHDGILGDSSGRYSKHIFLGESRLVTKVLYGGGGSATTELGQQYYYHADHLGSAQLITNAQGEEYERVEYTPYGELWIEKASTASVLEIPYRFTGKERDTETGLYYYGARYLDSKTGRWLSTDPALGEYVPGAPVNDEAKKRNGNLPGQGGVFNTVNLHLYHYAGNNPLKYTDPDGNYINSIFSYSKMGDNPWGNNKINSIDKSEMGKYGCAITGMANIFTTALNNREGNGYHTRSLATPVFINKKENFDTNTDNIDWSAVANSMGMKATRSKVGDSDAAIASLLSANMSGKNVSALVQVPITTSQGDSNHWVGVDGNLVDLKNNNELWVKVSPTSTNDNRNRLGNSNWAQGNDGSMYVKVQSITGTVIVE